MAYLLKDKRGYYRLFETINGRTRYLRYIGKDPSSYLAELKRGKQVLKATIEYPDLAVKGGQAALTEYKRRKISKVKISNKTYKTIIVDPPWPVEKIARNVSPNQYEFEYPTMTLEEIADLPIPTLADKEGCHIYLWTTQKFLPVSFGILAGWGAKYIFTMVWHKNGGFQPFNLPQYNSEFVLFGKIGSLDFINTKQFFTCFNGVRREHSRKPIEFDDIVRRVSPEPRYDYFSRELKEGFEQYGNEADKFKG